MCLRPGSGAQEGSMTTYGVTTFGKRRHVMVSHGLRVGWAKCCVDADYLPVKANAPRLARIAKFPVCRRCLPCR
jgi:hypothetical protein